MLTLVDTDWPGQACWLSPASVSNGEKVNTSRDLSRPTWPSHSGPHWAETSRSGSGRPHPDQARLPQHNLSPSWKNQLDQFRENVPASLLWFQCYWPPSPGDGILYSLYVLGYWVSAKHRPNKTPVSILARPTTYLTGPPRHSSAYQFCVLNMSQVESRVNVFHPVTTVNFL